MFEKWGYHIYRLEIGSYWALEESGG